MVIVMGAIDSYAIAEMGYSDLLAPKERAGQGNVNTPRGYIMRDRIATNQNEKILKRLEELEFKKATEIQEKIIPYILDGCDVLGQSQTGTGKTLAFSLPIVENIESNKLTQALILAPTRELAIQIQRDIDSVIKYLKVKTVAVYGSSSIENQIKDLKKGSEIVVGTPGRVMDLIKRKVLKLSEIKYFVLDEADEMLSMGFKEELEFIFNSVNNDKQVLLFSATMPKEIMNIAKNYMSVDYVKVSVSRKQEPTKNVVQEYYTINNEQRLESLCRIIDFYEPVRSMIFCRTKRDVDSVLTELYKRGYSVDAIHGDITQGQRIATLDKFKSGLFNFLIATDVAARGIHVNDVDYVFNYHFPDTDEAYIHRIGRTGRVDKKGVSVTFITKREERFIKNLMTNLKVDITKKQLPNKSEIMQNKVSVVENKIRDILNSDFETSLFNDYLNCLTDEDLKKVLNKFLIEKLNSSFGSDFDVELISNKKTVDKKDYTRLFLTIGKLDNIKGKDFIKFLEQKSGVSANSFENLEIMPKFTFLSVPKDKVKTIIKKCNNTKYNNRTIRIEVANKNK